MSSEVDFFVLKFCLKKLNDECLPCDDCAERDYVQQHCRPNGTVGPVHPPPFPQYRALIDMLNDLSIHVFVFVVVFVLSSVVLDCWESTCASMLTTVRLCSPLPAFDFKCDANKNVVSLYVLYSSVCL
jgi:hypothetical protein